MEENYEEAIEDLRRQLEAEIAARELLEKRLNSQSSGLANAENRLSSQIQTVSSGLESRMSTVEDLTVTEAATRTSADDSLRSSINTNAWAISNEADARARFEQEMREQAQKNLESMAVLDSRIESCEAGLKESSSVLTEERRERTDSQNAISNEVQTAKFDLLQKISEHNTTVEMLNTRVSELGEQIAAEASARENTDASVQANKESIDNATQRLIAVESGMLQMEDKLIDKELIPGLVSEAVSDEFEAQKAEVQSMLDSGLEARQADFVNIQQCMMQVQTIHEQSEGVLSRCKDSVASLREAFNLLLPKGTILPYGGNLASVPDGWQLCNGANGTPDLVGKVLVGAHAVSEIETEYLLGAEGGEKEVILNNDNLPQHFHYTGAIKMDNSGSVFVNGYGEKDGQATLKDVPVHDKLWGVHEWAGRKMQAYVHSIDALEEGTAVNALTSAQVTCGEHSHNNMQPYYCVYYIMKMF